MIEINELRITDDSQHFIIDVQISPDSYYDNVYLDSIYIDDQDSFVSPTDPVGAVYEYKLESDTKTVRFELTPDDISRAFNSNLFFVYITATGEPSEDAPCGTTSDLVMQTVVNLYPLFQHLMKYVREVEDVCSLPVNFVDQYLRFKAFLLALTTGNYTLAIYYWTRFFKNLNYKSTVCGCYGRVNYNRD